MIGVNVPGGYLVSGCEQGVRSDTEPSYQFRPNAKICSTNIYVKLDLSYVRDKLKEWVKKKGSTGGVCSIPSTFCSSRLSLLSPLTELV